MKALKSFFMTSLMGGLIVLLPIGLLVFILSWLYGTITSMIKPLTDVVVEKWALAEHAANGVVIVLGIITSLLPAWRAARYHPVEALSRT